MCNGSLARVADAVQLNSLPCVPASCRVLFRWATGNCGATMVESYHQLRHCEGSKHVSDLGLRLQTDCAAGQVVAAFVVAAVAPPCLSEEEHEQLLALLRPPGTLPSPCGGRRRGAGLAGVPADQRCGRC